MEIVYSAEVAKQMQKAGVAMQFEATPRGSNDWRDCVFSDGSACDWGDRFRYRVKPTETGATNEPRNPARIPVGAKVRVVKNNGEHNAMPVGSEGDLIKDDHSPVPYKVDFGGEDIHWFEADQIKMIDPPARTVSVSDWAHSHRHDWPTDGTSGNPIKLIAERMMNGRQIHVVSSQIAEQLCGRIQPTESKNLHEAKALRDYQRMQLEAYNAFFKPDLGEPYQSDTIETDEQIIARLLS
jgi:hypothetical protein